LFDIALFDIVQSLTNIQTDKRTKTDAPGMVKFLF
jgi:hypothetical protein